ncbi:LacI family DNA-binding transcriptional regulator [Acuticoccus kandeliae]|uniref:LacI family DNA-binding transcriptional regulator n=1 Tax=Acuticoccus kandeliae TaxID=2073160 RepID=UPI000D3E2632|nr:LacI family DNA-binding transcriptional regulator [Acuticoccus kandeliae]
MNKRVTLKDIARATGFHVSTVSRALDLNSRITLTEDVVRQIREAADAMGYRRNRVASGLRTNRTMTIGVVIPDITNDLFPPIVRGIESVLEPEGYASIIVNTDNLPEREIRLVDVLTERGVDGILHAAPLRTDTSISGLLRQGIPVVTLNRRIEGSTVPYVVNDERAGIEMMLRHLHEAGHRRIAHIAGPQALSTGAVRLEAFRDTCAALGLDEKACPIAVSERFDDDEGRRCAAELLDGKAAFTAILAANDRLALGAIDTLKKAGRAVPTDVSVTGFNDLPSLQLIEPKLTTIRIQHFEAGRAAARILLSMLLHPEEEIATETVLPVEIVARESVAPPDNRKVKKQA